MLPGIGWCGTGLPPFPTACWWLTHPAAITDVSAAARWNSPGRCGGPSVLFLCNRRVQSTYRQFASGALAGHNVMFAYSGCSCLARQLIGSVEELLSPGALLHWDLWKVEQNPW